MIRGLFLFLAILIFVLLFVLLIVIKPANFTVVQALGWNSLGLGFFAASFLPWETWVGPRG